MAACNLCGGTRWRTLEEVGTTRVVRCACGLVFVTPQPERPSIEQAYDAGYYRPWEEQARRRALIWGRRIERVEALRSPPGRLLDIGCGRGAFLHVARERGWEVSGTEISPYAAKAAGAARFPVVEGEVWEAGFPAGAFDVVTCWHVIEHAADPRRILQEIHRVLKPGGWLVLATPNLEDHIFRAAYVLARRHAPPLYEPDERELHLFHFSGRTLRALVASARFEVVEVGFDRGAAAVWDKRLVNEFAYLWFRLTGLNWGMALELVARTPGGSTDEDGEVTR
ncbi:MAG: class I SAM-dependent methyltransferase [Candidatus Rokubacteria bacterium]|nr:class I SAM-dependent methyltransferase [Candidatus Rokubacteria bacterium]